MSDSDRRSQLTLGGIAVCIFALFLAPLLVGKHPTEIDDASVTHRSSEQAQPAVEAFPLNGFSLEEQACADGAAATADDTQQHDKRDLCAQFRAAAAAERTADLTDWQTRVGIGGLVLVLVGLWLNYVATKAATDAANATREANQQAREFFVEERRAWISVSATATRIIALQNGAICHVVLRAKNIGLSPALDVAFWVNYDSSLLWEDDREGKALAEQIDNQRREPHPLGGYIFPGEERAPKMATVQMGGVVSEEAPAGFFWVSGWAVYRLEKDGASHFTPFAANVVYWRSQEAHNKGAFVMNTEMQALSVAPD